MGEWVETTLGDVTTQVRDSVKVADGVEYKLLGVHWYAEGAFHRETVTSKTSKAKTLYRVRPGQFIYNRLFAWKGSFGLVTDDLAGCYVSNEFPLFDCDPERLVPEYLAYFFGRRSLWNEIERVSTGTTASRNRWNEPSFNTYRISLPPVTAQRRIITVMSAVDTQIGAMEAETSATDALAQRIADDGYDQAIIGGTVSLELVTSKVQNGVMYKRGAADGGWPVTRIETISGGRIDLSRTGRAGFTDHNAHRFVLDGGDILFSNKNSPDRVGTTAYVRQSHLPLINGDNILQIRACGIDPGYLFSMLRSKQLRWTIRKLSRPAVNQASVNAAQVKALQIPVADEPMQARLSQRFLAALELAESQRAELAALRRVRADLLSGLLSRAVTVDEVVDQVPQGAA
jgi:type I restriction enzyme S subunit